MKLIIYFRSSTYWTK